VPTVIKPRSRGEQTRQAILARALKISAQEGLAALTIGRLAKELQLSKSGLFAHFHSKQALELATIAKAEEFFADAVLRPAQASGDGIERLWNLCDLWLLHIERHEFSGSYFFTGAFFEHADQPGPLSKAVKSAAHEWINALRKAIEAGQEQGEIDPDAEAKQVASELNARLVGAYWEYLLGGGNSLREARTTLLGRLRELAPAPTPASAFESVGAWKKYLEKKR